MALSIFKTEKKLLLNSNLFCLETATWSIPQINPALIVPRARNNYCAGVFEDGKVLTKNYELVQRFVDLIYV